MVTQAALNDSNGIRFFLNQFSCTLEQMLSQLFNQTEGQMPHQPGPVTPAQVASQVSYPSSRAGTLPQAAPPQAKTPKSEPLQETRYWLNQLGPLRKNHRVTWIRVGQALHSEHGDDGLTLWIEWTTEGRFSSGFYTASDCERLFAKFRDTSRYSRNTIIRWATEDQKDGGWGAEKVSPAPKAPTESAAAKKSAAKKLDAQKSAAKKSDAQSGSQKVIKNKKDFIACTTPTPNYYYDHIFPFLDSSELRVFLYLTRLTLGYRYQNEEGIWIIKRQDRIAFSQFVHGRMKSDGTRLDYGANLGEEACRKALGRLKKFGLVIELAPNDPKRNHGKLYAPQLDALKIDMEALLAREVKKNKRFRRQTEAARKALADKAQIEQKNTLNTTPSLPKSVEQPIEASDTSATQDNQARNDNQEAQALAHHAQAQAVTSDNQETQPPTPQGTSANNVQKPASLEKPVEQPPRPSVGQGTQNRSLKKEDTAYGENTPTHQSLVITSDSKSESKLDLSAIKAEVLPSLRLFNNNLEKPFHEGTLLKMNQMACERLEMTDQDMCHLIEEVNNHARVPAGFLYYTLIKGDGTGPFVPSERPESTGSVENQTVGASVVPIASSSPPTGSPLDSDGNRSASKSSSFNSILSTLQTINGQRPTDSYPLTGINALAGKLNKRGETGDSVLSAWETCQQHADLPMGAFLTWVNKEILPFKSRKKKYRFNEYELYHYGNDFSPEEAAHLREIDERLAAGETLDDIGVEYF